MTDKQEFAVLLTAVAAMIPGFTLTKELTALYDDAASKNGYGKSARSLKRLMVTRSPRDPFPSIGEIIANAELCNTDPDEVAMKIAGAISRFGSYRGFEAREFLGETAWKIITIEGGWESLCLALTYENMTTFQAQWRRLATVIIEREKNDAAVQIGFLRSLDQVIGPQLKKISTD